jgi:hypothetical protein
MLMRIGLGVAVAQQNPSPTAISNRTAAADDPSCYYELPGSILLLAR